MVAVLERPAVSSQLEPLLRALQRLDSLLGRAVETATDVYGPEAATDPHRGLHISPSEVQRLLDREPGKPVLWRERDDSPETEQAWEGSRLASLQGIFGLSPFDMDLVLLALAPEIDLRYERLYAYLQDDVTRKRPTVDLALNLLCSSAAVKLTRRRRFAPEAPLIRHRVLRLSADPHQPGAPLLARYLELDEQIVRFLLAEPGLDPRLAPVCERIEPAGASERIPIEKEVTRRLHRLVSSARRDRRALRVYFHGPCCAAARKVAEAVAAETTAPLLAADCSRLDTTEAELGKLGELAEILVREARLGAAVLYLEDVDALRGAERPARLERLLDILSEHRGVALLSGTRPWTASGRVPLDVVCVPLPVPAFAQRRACWSHHLAEADGELNARDLDTLASRFRLTAGQIAAAFGAAGEQARWRGGRARPTLDDLFAAARDQTGQNLAPLTQKVRTIHTWDDIVLSEDVAAQLRELCQRIVHRRRVLSEWGFDGKLSQGKGVAALFAGPSGTGKTMAAGVLARELGLDLYRIDLAAVVSKYIGETEKNLDRIFIAAESANAILFFDEADALFGKRSEVRDSHDRYANIEIAYLLQKMEDYDGVAILATNLRQNLDEAFVRRLACIVAFPFPDEELRRRIWHRIWPREARLADDVDLDSLAHRFKLTGGNIKNIALASAFLAAEDGDAVSAEHLLHATRREYQKMGKVLTD